MPSHEIFMSRPIEINVPRANTSKLIPHRTTDGFAKRARMKAFDGEELIELEKAMPLSCSHPVVTVGDIPQRFVEGPHCLVCATTPEHRWLRKKATASNEVQIEGQHPVDRHLVCPIVDRKR